MNYDEINVEEEVKRVAAGIERGMYRPATRQEAVTARLAALSGVVHEMQASIPQDNSPQLVNVAAGDKATRNGCDKSAEPHC